MNGTHAVKKQVIGLMLITSLVAALAGFTPTQSKAGSAKITLRFATFAPPRDINSVIMAEWAKQLSAKTDGRIKVQLFYSQSLVKIPEMLDAVASGTTDMAFLNTVPFPDRLPLSQIMGMPLMAYAKSEQASLAWWSLYQKYPEMQKEYADAGLKVLWVAMPGPNQIEGKVEIKKLEDLNGLRAGVETREESKAFELFGAASVTLQGADMYTSLERSVIQTSTQNFTGSMIWKTHQIAPCFTENVDLNFRVCPIVINLESYAKIPDDLKPVFDEISEGKYWCRYNGQAIDETNSKNRTAIIAYHQKHGNTGVYALPDKEKKRLRQLVMPINNTWAEEMEAKGLPGKNILEDVQRLAITEEL